MNSQSSLSSKWPKKVADLTEEQIRISSDWMQYFHEINRDKFSGFVDFGHKYVAEQKRPSDIYTLEIGAGLGAHLKYENKSINPAYIATESRVNMANELHKNYPDISSCVSDCQGYLPFKNNSMDRVIAIHVLEHLPNLPACLLAVRDVLKPDGRFLVVIPCEGGGAYEIARTFTSKRMFEKRYKTSYKWHIESEHVNTAGEIISELNVYFEIVKRQFYPFLVPMIHPNFVIGLTLTPKAK